MDGWRMITLIAVAAFVPATAPTQEGTRVGSVVGTVTDQETRRPVSRVVLRLGETTLTGTTDDAGRYLIRAVPGGTYVLRASRIGYRPVSQFDVVVDAGRSARVDVELDRASVALGAVLVEAEASGKPRAVTTSSAHLSYEEIRRSPGAIGDVSRLVQSLPGVVISNDQRNDIVARGGSPAENLTVVDNVEVPNLNHFAAQGTTGGPISMLNNEFVRDATFLAGGFPAQFGNRLSSVLDIRLREGSRSGFESELDVSFAGAGVIAEGPLTRKGTWIASGRKSFLEILAKPFGLAAVPHTANYQIKATFEPSDRDKLWLVGLGGRDDISFEVDAADPKETQFQNSESRAWRTVTGINWQHLFAGGFGVLSIADSYSTFDVDVRDAMLGNRQTFRSRSAEGETTAKYDVSLRFGAVGELLVGASGKRFRGDFRIAQPLGVRNPFSTDSARVNAVAIDDRSAPSLLSTYAQVIRPVGARVQVTLGLRGDWLSALDRGALSPRAGATVRVTRTIDLNASYGRYHQQPALVFVRSDPINRMLAPIRADHYVAGLAYTPAPDVRVTLEAYRKRYANYPVSLEHPTFSLANTGDYYDVGGLLFPMVSRGRGRSEGVELYVQQKLSTRTYGQLSYTYSRTRHAGLDGVFRRGGFDIPHTVTVIGGVRPGPRWELAARFSHGSGRPVTPVLSAESAAQNRPIYDLSRVNATRAPAYQRLDLRGDRRFSVRRVNVTMFLEVQNVYDHDNVFQYVWNRRTRSVVPEHQIGFLPILGVNVQL